MKGIKFGDACVIPSEGTKIFRIDEMIPQGAFLIVANDGEKDAGWKNWDQIVMLKADEFELVNLVQITDGSWAKIIKRSKSCSKKSKPTRTSRPRSKR